MKIQHTPNDDGGALISASADELQLLAYAVAQMRPAPEEKGLHRKMTQQLNAALPVADDPPNSADDDELDETERADAEDDFFGDGKK